MAKKLSPKQSRFVEEYLKDLNASAACVRAGYSEKGSHVTGSQLLAITSIRQIVDEALARRAARVEVTTDDILRELLRFATLDIGRAFDVNGDLLDIKDMPEDVRRSIASMEVEKLFEGHGDDREHVGYLRKVRFWDKTKGLELLGKHLKLFTDKVEHSGSVTLEQLVAASMEKKP